MMLFKGFFYSIYNQIFMKCWLNKITSSQRIAFIISLIFAITLVPILRIGIYNYPSADDYSFSLKTFEAWQSTHSFKIVLEAAVQTVIEYYHTWQGTYSAIFFMTLQPAVFGSAFYKMVPFLLIGSLIGSYLWFTNILLCQILKASKSDWIIICISLLFLTILFPVSPVEAFYWYNGSVFYNFFFILSILLFGSLLSAIRASSRAKKSIYSLISVILSFLIAGGNFTTGLVIPLILGIAIGGLCLVRKKVPAILILSLGSLLTGLVISILAPGNDVRQLNFADTPTPFEAIFKSITYGLHEFIHWLKLPVLLITLFITPTIYRIVKKSNYLYRYPGVFLIITFGIFCAMFTPPFYAMNMPGPGRLINICKFAYLWILIANLFYICGYLSHRAKYSKLISALSVYLRRSKTAFFFSGSAISLLAICIFGSAAIRSRSVAYIAWKSLQMHQAQQYGEEMEARMIAYRSPLKTIEVDTLSSKPVLLFFSDITIDKEHWHNKDVARFFNKESVQLKVNQQ